MPVTTGTCVVCLSVRACVYQHKDMISSSHVHVFACFHCVWFTMLSPQADILDQGHIARQLKFDDIRSCRQVECISGQLRPRCIRASAVGTGGLVGPHLALGNEPVSRTRLLRAQARAQVAHFAADGEVGGNFFGRARAAAAGGCLLYTSPSPRDLSTSRMPSSA